ncbi:MAG: hypothetical protein IMHGJWDQ_000459 [Candidatus Fervidibacter sp.]
MEPFDPCRVLARCAVKGLFDFYPYAITQKETGAMEGLVLFALGAVLMEAGMGRAKGALHSFVKGLTAFAVGVLLGSIKGSGQEALLGGTVSLLTTTGLGDRVTLIGAAILGATVAVLHRLLWSFDRLLSVAANVHLPDPFASMAWVRDWLVAFWLPDYAALWSVHALTGGAAFGALLAAGPRVGRYSRNGTPAAMPAHNLSLAGAGMFLLWLGARAFSAPLWESATLSAFVAWLSALVWTKWRFGKTDPSFAFTAFWAGLIAGLAVGGVSFLPVAFVGLVTGALAISFSLTLDRHFVDDPVGIVAAEGIAPLVGLVGQWLWRERLFGVGLVSWLISFGLGLLAVWLTGKLLASLGLLRPLPMDEFVGLDQRLYGITAYPEFEMREA